ncbi:MAG: SusD/RagB family nutrient-binding outer membrane lipoprotein [Bacteroidota bacterium]|nr:SusD/RagB family nutrient-binding outer membrane lipoprotein [Odoribacter sp.]MDP3644672.1 SusD/RagB family nutrient-binding outer membrane lipoprotein [Bacteroidota bacterium]
MKKSIYKIGTLVLAIVLTTMSCSKLEDFGSTNVNPAATNKPITSALLTNVLSGFGEISNNRVTALYCQYFSETQYPDVSNYSANTASPMATYSGVLYDLQNIIITNTAEDTKAIAALNGANANQIAIARILKAFIFQRLTDRWGDIPYSQALKGDPNVAFDTQESIYKDLIKELTEAVAQVTTGAPIKGDIAYNGDMTKWKKLANSMRMIMALRLSKKYPGASDYAATQFKAALNDPAGSIATNADNFRLDYPGSAFKNPFYNMYDGRKDYGESETMTTLLNSLGSDARQAVFGATSSGAATTKGVPYGRARTFIDPWCGANPDYAYVFAPAYRTQTSPIFIIKAASILLARAEAADRGWTTESTATLYTAGINASHEQWGLALPSATYFANANIALGAAGTNLPQIAKQAYVAYFPDGCSGYANWRRTGIPALTPAPDATNNPKVIPRRFMYGTSDYTLAKTGVEAAVARLTGGDKMDSKVWWDQ